MLKKINIFFIIIIIILKKISSLIKNLKDIILKKIYIF